MEAKISCGVEEGAMGMSYELADAQVADMRAQVWTLTRASFTGAAILLREKAGYRSTSFRVKRPVTALRGGVGRWEDPGSLRVAAGRGAARVRRVSREAEGI